MTASDRYLVTERLILRRFTPADADHLVALDSDPEVMRYLNGGIPTPRAVIAATVLPGFLRSYKLAPGFGVWAAIEKGSGDFLGWFSFRPHEGAPTGSMLLPPDLPVSAQADVVAAAGVLSRGFNRQAVVLGYRLRRAAWGQGYATEGARALLRKGFAELGVGRVVATTYEYNYASRQVMAKLGMRHVRSFRLSADDLARTDTFAPGAGEVWEGDEVEYAIDRAQWERAQTGATAQG